MSVPFKVRSSMQPHIVAGGAVEFADALLAELERVP
jgi:hypothetical protein